MAKNGAGKLAWIERRLAEGSTVYVSTYTRATKVTPKVAARWAKAGHDLFRVDAGDSLYMARGSRFVCIDYAGLRAYNADGIPLCPSCAAPLTEVGGHAIGCPPRSRMS